MQNPSVSDSYLHCVPIWFTLLGLLSYHFKFPEGSASESDDYNEPQDPAEETDDDENIYFDTRDFLSSSSFKSSGSDFQRSEAGSDDEDDYPMDGIDPSMKSVGISYPYVRRRKKLPDPVEKEKGVSLWSMIKDNIGKDLTKVCLPVYFNEPLSSLQKCFEDLEYSYLIDRASEWGKRVLLFFSACQHFHSHVFCNIPRASSIRRLIFYIFYFIVSSQTCN